MRSRTAVTTLARLASIAILLVPVACLSEDDQNRSTFKNSANDGAEVDTSANDSSHKKKTKPDKKKKSRPPKTKARGGATGSLAVVSRVIDGDTIEVLFKGSSLDIRLIGVDTPETVHPTVGVECFGKEASAFTERSLEGRDVRLEFDVEREDRYGRTLAYVWVDGAMFNETLVSEGYGQVSTYPPNVKYVDLFVEAQRDARSAGRGLWASTCANEDEEEAPAETGGESGGNCDPNYSGACVPPYSEVGDLDCPDVGATNFQSTGSDPHGFDGDGDGVACEA